MVKRVKICEIEECIGNTSHRLSFPVHLNFQECLDDSEEVMLPPGLFKNTARTFHFIATLQPLCRLAWIEATSVCRININPYEVENCLKGHPAVLDCAVVSSPSLMTQVSHINRDNLCGIFICANAVKAKGDVVNQRRQD